MTPINKSLKQLRKVYSLSKPVGKNKNLGIYRNNRQVAFKNKKSLLEFKKKNNLDGYKTNIITFKGKLPKNFTLKIK